MKNISKKIMAILMVFTVVFSFVMPTLMSKNQIVYAEGADAGPTPPPTPPSTQPLIPPPLTHEEEEEEPKTQQVILHKLLMTEKDLTDWNSDAIKKAGYDGTQNLENLKSLSNKDLKEIAGVYFAWQGNFNGTWKYIDKNGAEVADADAAFGMFTTVTGAKFDTSSLPQDKATQYRIVEVKEKSTHQGDGGKTLGNSLAVPVVITLPLVNNKGVQGTVHVYPKNSEAGAPTNTKELDKNPKPKVEDMSVNVGDTVPYKVTTTIKAGSTYKQVAWNDRMSKGLTFNKDVKITTEPNLNLKDVDYTLEQDADNGFVLKLKDSGLEKLASKTAGKKANFMVNGNEVNGLNKEVVFTLKYSATVNGEALVDNALENTNTFYYGNNPNYTPEPGDKNPQPQTGVTQIKVDKTFSEKLSTDDSIAWPNDLTIGLKLQVYDPANNTWSDVAGKTGELNSTETSFTFKGLEKAKTYKVVENDTKGWVPNYKVGSDGNLKVVNKKNPNPEPITPAPVVVRTGGHRFQKVDFTTKEGLAGAVFNISNADGSKWLKAKDADVLAAEQEKYITAEKAYQDAIKAGTPADDLKKARDTAYRATTQKFEWVADKAGIYEVTAGKNGYFKITGIEYGAYQLHETTPPDGYAKNNTPVDFTVAANSFEAATKVEAEPNTDTGLTQVDNKKVTIPQTGGIGTLIFIVAGLAIMGGAVLAMKRRNSEEA